jgi:hypothetical protein
MSYVSRAQASKSPEPDRQFARDVFARAVSYLPFVPLPLYLVGFCIVMFIPTTPAEVAVLIIAIVAALANTVYFTMLSRIRHKIVLSFHFAVLTCLLSLPWLLLAYNENHRDKGFFALRFIAMLFFVLLILREILYFTLEEKKPSSTPFPSAPKKSTRQKGKKPYSYRSPAIFNLIWKRQMAKKKAASTKA